MKRRIASIAAAVCMLASAGAHADIVKITGYEWGSSDIDTSMTGTVGVGEFKGLLNGNAFVTYCTDIFESFSWNVSYDNYFVAANGSTYGFTNSQAGMLSKLYTVADALVNTRDESVAFQLAVWEILYDTSYQVSNVAGRGTFYVEDGGTSGQRSLANNWLAQASALGSSQFNVVRLASVDAPRANDGHQDFILVSHVPEPATYALMLAGLGGMALASRRKRVSALPSRARSA